MGRRKARRRQRHGEDIPINPLKRVQAFVGTPEEIERQRQDFTAGTILAAGADIVLSDTSEPLSRPVLVIYVEPGPVTWGPAPELRQLFELLDRRGADHLLDAGEVATSWSVLPVPDEPLVKFKAQVREPKQAAGRFEIVLRAADYQQIWPHVVVGCPVAITTFDRAGTTDPAASLNHATSPPSLKRVRENSLLLTVGASPGLATLMNQLGWNPHPHQIVDEAGVWHAADQTDAELHSLTLANNVDDEGRLTFTDDRAVATTGRRAEHGRVPVALFEPRKAMLTRPTDGSPPQELQVEGAISAGMHRVGASPQLAPADGWTVNLLPEGRLELHDREGGLWSRITAPADPQWQKAAQHLGVVACLYGPQVGVRRPPKSARWTDKDRTKELAESCRQGLVAGGLATFRDLRDRETDQAATE